VRRDEKSLDLGSLKPKYFESYKIKPGAAAAHPERGQGSFLQHLPTVL